MRSMKFNEAVHGLSWKIEKNFKRA